MKSKITNACARHREMVLDPYRTPFLKAAIEKVARPGDIVVDVGCGMGILGFLAVQAGAAHVHAIDCDEGALEAGRFFAKKWGIENKLTFHNTLSFEFELPQKADVLLCEIIGSLAFDENMLLTLLDARKRLLKPGGKIIPETLELWGALVDDRALYQGWSDVAGLDLREVATPLSDWRTISVFPEWLLSEAKCLTAINALIFTQPRVEIQATFTVKNESTLRLAETHSGLTLGGICLWPKIYWEKNTITDASPFMPTTHWKQGFLPLAPRLCKPGEPIDLHLIIEPKENEEHIRTDILWKVS